MTKHFKPPAVQGWALKHYGDEVEWAKKEEANCTRYRRRRGCFEPGRLRDVRAALERLRTEVAVGCELLYDGLPASSLDGQPLAAAIMICTKDVTLPTQGL
jgi:hypothetical protein